MNRRRKEARLAGSRTDLRLPFAEARRAKAAALAGKRDEAKWH